MSTRQTAPFTADRNKLAYAQAFTRETTAHPHGLAGGERSHPLRTLGARLHRTSSR